MDYIITIGYNSSEFVLNTLSGQNYKQKILIHKLKKELRMK